MSATPANIVLIGYRGTGKTSVARELAARLGRPWLDADQELERAAGKTIAAIFADGGESVFRDWEERIITRLGAMDGVVIATGGGAVLRASNRQALARHGRFVWLQASPEAIHARLQADAATTAQRPSLTRLGELDEIRELLAQRAPIYASLAEATVDTERKGVSELADEIIAAWRLPLRAEAT